MPILEPKDQYTKVGDVRTRYWKAGCGESVVLFVHGFSAAVEYWRYNVFAVARDFTAYALDLIGLGYTDKPDVVYTSELFARFVRDFMDMMKIKKATLVGHSMGGAVVLDFAFMYPERLDKLVLVSPAGLDRWLPWRYRLLSVPILGNLMLSLNRKRFYSLIKGHVCNLESLTDAMVDKLYTLTQLPGVRRTLLSVIHQNTNLLGVRKEVYLTIQANLQNISTPTLVIWGHDDPLIPVSHSRILVEKLPNVTLKLIKDCGHIPQMEWCAEFNHLLRGFLLKD